MRANAGLHADPTRRQIGGVAPSKKESTKIDKRQCGTSRPRNSGASTRATEGQTAMRVRFLTATAAIASSVIVTTVLVQSLSTTSAQTETKPRYLPEYTADGDLILPKNVHGVRRIAPTNR
jgi:hypothetical protein